MKRRKLSLGDKLEIVAAQAKCARCGEPLGPLVAVEYDHSHALALGGSDTNDNMRAIHHDCHSEKTNGKPATSYGSDKHAIAKVRRLSAAQEETRRRLLAKEPGEKPARKSRWASRPFGKKGRG